MLDFDDESTEGVKKLLLHCVMSPVVLRSAQGRRFLVTLFGLHLSLIDDIHATVKVCATRVVCSVWSLPKP